MNEFKESQIIWFITMIIIALTFCLIVIIVGIGTENTNDKCKELGYESAIIGKIDYCKDIEGNLIPVEIDCKILKCDIKKIKILDDKE